MENLSELCFSCMRPLNAEGVCPHCGDTAPILQESPLLSLGSIINDRYYIGKAIKSNGEGITYVAYDQKLEQACTLREFFPSTIAERDADGMTVLPLVGSQMAYDICHDAFFKLWSKLMRLKGLTALISVYDVFRANGTVYAVYSDSEETTLRTYLLSNGSGYIPWEQARILFMPVLSTLSTLHTSGIIHCGIDPSALIMSPNGKLKLTDFCISDVKTAYGELETDISDGYAPLEVYSETGDTGSWTDIYSFTAVLFRALVGSTPIPAPVRAQNDQMMIPAKFAEQLPPYVINAIINGMQLDEKDRTRNAEQLRSNLSASPRAIGASAANFTKNASELNAKGVQERSQRERSAAPQSDSASGAGPAIYYEQVSEERIRKAREAEAKANKKNNLRKRLTVLMVAVLLLMLVGIGLVVSEIINSAGSKNTPQQQPTQQTEMISVPSFVGQMYDAVTSDTYYSTQLTFATVTQPSDTVPRGQVIAQDTPASSVVLKGTRITLTVSTGPNIFEIPDVSGQTYEAAYAALSSRGLVCQKSAKYNDGTHPSDTVAETVPEAGSQAKAGDTVYIVMWTVIETTTAPGTSVPATQPTQPTAPATQPATQPTIP